MKNKEFSFKNKFGESICGFVFFPDGKGPFDTVIFSHGFASCYEELYHHGEGFAKRGIIAVFFDFRGGGPFVKSDGVMQDMSVLTEKDDLFDVYSVVSSWKSVKMDRIFLAGESQGGFVSCHLASEHPDLFAGLILWYPAFNMPDACRKRLEEDEANLFGFSVGNDFDAAAASVNIFDRIRLFSKPVLILHGDLDKTVPLEYSKKAVDIFPDARLVTLPGGHHGFDGALSKRAEDLSVAFIAGDFIQVLVNA